MLMCVYTYICVYVILEVVKFFKYFLSPDLYGNPVRQVLLLPVLTSPPLPSPPFSSLQYN